MKKSISAKDLKKKVSDGKAEVTKVKKAKTAKKETSKKQPAIPEVTMKSAEIVMEMAKTLSSSADQVSESAVIMAKVAKTIQESSKEKSPVVVEFPKERNKRKWRFTTVRDENYFIKSIDVVEL